MQPHCTSGAHHGRTPRLYVWRLSRASATGEFVSIYVDYNHPLLQLKRALPWEALFEVMTCHWRRAGKNTDGRPGLPWDVALYVPLVVLMVVKNLNAREMEAYVQKMLWRVCSLGDRTPPGLRFGTIPISPGPMLPSARTGSRRSMR